MGSLTKSRGVKRARLEFQTTDIRRETASLS